MSSIVDDDSTQVLMMTILLMLMKLNDSAQRLEGVDHITEKRPQESELSTHWMLTISLSLASSPEYTTYEDSRFCSSSHSCYTVL